MSTNIPSSTLQFGRYLAAIISRSDGSYIWVDNVHDSDSVVPSLGSSASMKFTTTAQLVNAPAALSLTIYNPDPLIYDVARSEGALVQLIAGYLGVTDPSDANQQFGSTNFNFPPPDATYSQAQISAIASRNLQTLQHYFPKMDVSVIFNGTVAQAKVGRENGTDTYVEIIGIDGDFLYLNGFVSTSIPAGTGQRSQMNQITTFVQNDITNNLRQGAYSPYSVAFGNLPEDGVLLHRGQVHFGKYTDILHRFAANNNADFYIQNNTPTFLSRNDAVLTYTTVISSSTGMIGLPVQTIDGIKVRTLLNPHIIQGILVQLTTKDIQPATTDITAQGTSAINERLSPIDNGIEGKYKVLVATHNGHTRDHEWYTEIICYSQEQQSTSGSIGGEPNSSNTYYKGILNPNVWY